MRIPGSGRPSPIGVDVGPRTIGAVQASWRAGRWWIDAAAVVDRPPIDSATPRTLLATGEAARLSDVLYRQGFSGRRIALVVPDAQLLTAVLELPPRASAAPVEQLAKMELARIHKREPGSLEMACWDIPAPARPGETSHVMAAACAHDDATRVLDSFQEGGFTVETLDARAWAMARACTPALQDDQNVSALLDLGESSASLSIIRAGMVVYHRLMPESGLASLRARLCSDLKLEPDVADYVLSNSLGGEATPDGAQVPPPQGAGAIHDHVQAVIVELRSAMDYALHRYPGSVDRLLVMGSGAAIPTLAPRLAAGLGVPARAVAPADLAECPGSLLEPCRDPGLTTALGLAAWGRGRAA